MFDERVRHAECNWVSSLYVPRMFWSKRFVEHSQEPICPSYIEREHCKLNRLLSPKTRHLDKGNDPRGWVVAREGGKGRVLQSHWRLAELKQSGSAETSSGCKICWNRRLCDWTTETDCPPLSDESPSPLIQLFYYQREPLVRRPH